MSPFDLRDAFVAVLRRREPSDRECLAKLRDGGWTAESAAKHIGIHPGWIRRLQAGQHVNLGIRRLIASLPPAPANKP